MKEKFFPIKIKDKFYNFKNDFVINFKVMLIHYILNIFSTSHLYKTGKNYSFIPQNLQHKIFSQFFQKTEENDILIIPLGHASIYILHKKKGFLIDPIISSPSIFFKRYCNKILLSLLPSIDYIIYSHNHPDHYDLKSLQKILELFPFAHIVGPTGFVDLLSSDGIEKKKVTEYYWWETIILDKKESISITCVPSIHWSQSRLFNQNESLWSGSVLSLNRKTIYCTGDTAYGKHFQEIKKEFKKIDILICAIAPYQPEYLQNHTHLNPDEAYKVFSELGKPIFIPYHWGTFAYGEEKLKDPIEKIINLFTKHNDLHLLKSTIINFPYLYKEEKYYTLK